MIFEIYNGETIDCVHIGYVNEKRNILTHDSHFLRETVGGSEKSRLVTVSTGNDRLPLHTLSLN